MKRSQKLLDILNRIDGRGYKAYKDIQGKYHMGSYILSIDHAQSDPFAPPSKVRIIMPQDNSSFPQELFNTKSRKIALEDLIARKFKTASQSFLKKRGTGSSGLIEIDCGAQEIIERTSVKIDKGKLEVRLYIGLPAHGRKIVSKEAKHIFFHVLPKIINSSLLYKNLDKSEIERFVYINEDQDILRERLSELNLVAFIANGSILPRESGISDRPLLTAKRFISPCSLEMEIDLPYSGKIKGMGIPKGITLIVGGGFHGKSTLLRAIERGVYNHIPGDGREFVITVKDAVKIRSEDGRCVTGVDISPFISKLPSNIDTKNFSTQNASGSTSQAANIIEAIEAGTSLLLMDEDTCATNFMIRDGRMQRLVAKRWEPITPFVDRVRELYEKFGISTILVLGGSGDYFDVADNVIMLKEYQVVDVTKQAKEIAQSIKNCREKETLEPINLPKKRIIGPGSFKIREKDKIKARGLSTISIGKTNIDLFFVEQLVDKSQTNSIAQFFKIIDKKYLKNKNAISDIVDSIINEIEEKGLEILVPFSNGHPGSLAMPRKYEIMAAINRYRDLRLMN